MRFAVYDIESIMDDSQNKNIRNLLMVHKLATIAVKTNFGEETEHFFYRRDMSSTSLQSLVKEFVDKLTELRSEMLKELPPTIQTGLASYYEIIKSPDFKKRSVIFQNKVQAKIKILKQFMCLRIYSWNGGFV